VPEHDSIDWEVVQIKMKGPDMPCGIHLDHESLDLESELYVGEQCLVMK